MGTFLHRIVKKIFSLWHNLHINSSISFVCEINSKFFIRAHPHRRRTWIVKMRGTIFSSNINIAYTLRCTAGVKRIANLTSQMLCSVLDMLLKKSLQVMNDAWREIINLLVVDVKKIFFLVLVLIWKNYFRRIENTLKNDDCSNSLANWFVLIWRLLVPSDGS